MPFFSIIAGLLSCSAAAVADAIAAFCGGRRRQLRLARARLRCGAAHRPRSRLLRGGVAEIALP